MIDAIVRGFGVSGTTIGSCFAGSTLTDSAMRALGDSCQGAIQAIPMAAATTRVALGQIQRRLGFAVGMIGRDARGGVADGVAAADAAVARAGSAAIEPINASISVARLWYTGDERSDAHPTRLAAWMLPKPRGGATGSSNTGTRHRRCLPASASSSTHSDSTDVSVHTTTTARASRKALPMTSRQVRPVGMVRSQNTVHPDAWSAATSGWTRLRSSLA